MTPFEIREAASAAFLSPRQTGHVHFNTHHEVYLAQVSDTRWTTMPPHLVEMNDTQLDAWLGRLREVRRLVRALPVPEYLAA